MDFRSPGALHYRTALFLVAVSLALAAAIFFGFIHISYWIAALPAIYAWARPSVYRLMVGAYYHAMHEFENDMLDRDEYLNQYRMNEAVTLDTESYLRNLAQDDERAGRA